MKKRHTASARPEPEEKAGQLEDPRLIQISAAPQKVRINVNETARQTKTPGAKEPSAALMERLARGKRTVIDKKEMKKLSKINYENLPEIKRRKDDERKRLEALEKKERIAKYNKECKARSRAQLKKKREQKETVAAANQIQEEEKVVVMKK